MQRITVKEISKGRNDNSPFYVITSDGSRLSTTDSKIAMIAKGTQLDVEIEINKGYSNIKTWKVAEGIAPASPAPPKNDPPAPRTYEPPASVTQTRIRNEGLEIMRQVSNVLANGGSVPPGVSTKYWDAADKVLDSFLGGAK